MYNTYVLQWSACLNCRSVLCDWGGTSSSAAAHVRTHARTHTHTTWGYLTSLFQLQQLRYFQTNLLGLQVESRNQSLWQQIFTLFPRRLQQIQAPVRFRLHQGNLLSLTIQSSYLADYIFHTRFWKKLFAQRQVYILGKCTLQHTIQFPPSVMSLSNGDRRKL